MADKSLLIANVGNRDLQLDGQEMRPARIEGKKIKDRFAEYKDRLTTPILSPIIELITKEIKMLDIVLFCTDQKDEKHSQNDTIFFGECIKELWQNKKPIGKVSIKKIPGGPNLYDEMFKLYGTQLEKQKGIFDEYNPTYVGITGGTPACNMALCLHSIRLFGEKCIPVYTIEGKNKAIPLQIGKQLIEVQKKSLLQDQLQNYEYRVASKLLSDLGLPQLALLSEICLYRLNFDFKRADKLANKLINQEMGKIRDLCLEITNELNELGNKKLTALISEIYFNLQIKYKRGEYVDFLGRIFRFEEAILRFVIEKEEPTITTNIDNDGYNFQNYQESLKKVKGLISYLKICQFAGKELEYDKPNIPVLLFILEFMIKNGKGHLAVPYEGLKTLSKLTPLRNKSILAHDFSGASLEDIQKIINKFSLEYIDNLLANLQISLPKNPFDKLNKFILESICQDYT